MTKFAVKQDWATMREILAQPKIWRDWGNSFDPVPLRNWIKTLDLDEIWCVGAGSSAYIGDIVAAGLEGQSGPRIRSVPSTDIVSRPADFLGHRKVLLVNFGRSGNSTETIGTLKAIEVLSADTPCLNITCNANSALGKSERSQTQVVILPEATHDEGFAMTSSFTTMLMTALLVLDDTADTKTLGRLADALETAFAQMISLAAQTPIPPRVVFLGTGALAFAAREVALKVLELSAGKTMALWDSPLGFRHGPKSFLDPESQVVLFQSTDHHAARYEADLVEEIKQQYPTAALTTVGPNGDLRTCSDLPDRWCAPLMIAWGQVLAATWSDSLGINVDDPFAGQGTLTRVVSGVKLYDIDT